MEEEVTREPAGPLCTAPLSSLRAALCPVSSPPSGIQEELLSFLSVQLLLVRMEWNFQAPYTWIQKVQVPEQSSRSVESGFESALLFWFIDLIMGELFVPLWSQVFLL